MHDDTRVVTSAVATSVVLAPDLELLSAHGSGARWALTLALVCVPAIITVAFGAGRVRGIVLLATADVSLPELRAV